MTLIALGIDNMVQDMAQLLILAGLIILAMVVKSAADADGHSNRDPVLVILAGIAIILYSWGMIEPSIAGNTILQATPVSIAGLYLIMKAAVFALSSRKGD
jgi:hypothetical protein